MNSDLEKYFDEMFLDIDPSIKLDDEQKKAILCDEKNVMIVAGAGAGKTTTMSAKVKYLIEKKLVSPEEIVMISYTNKAVEELQKRINEDFKIPIQICTFHKLGLEIMKKANKRKKILVEDSFTMIKNIINQYLLKDENGRNDVLNYLCYYGHHACIGKRLKMNDRYKKIKTRIEYLSLLGQMKKHNHFQKEELEKEKLSIAGEFMDCQEELMVANFLFLHNVRYCYKEPYEYDREYVPDFCLYDDEGRMVYLELLFSNFNNYMDLLKREKTIRRIRKIHDRNHTDLLELEVKENFLDRLREMLLEKGFCLRRKNEKEVFEILNQVKETLLYKEFMNLCCNFLHCFKLSGYEEGKFDEWEVTENNSRSQLFLKLVKKIYQLYQRNLRDSGYCDFEDMIHDASDILKDGGLELPYRYIIVDEYQDISRERVLFLKRIVEICGAKLIVVGDDWQSIFSFAGSDISLFLDFERYMGKTHLLKITHTYRNSQELIDSAGSFVMKNEFQLQKKLISPKHLQSPISVYLYSEKKDKSFALQHCIESIVKKFGEETEILLLGRYKFDLYTILNKRYFVLRDERIVSLSFPKLRLVFMTVHAAKGLGFSNVVIINGEEGEYGFPSEKSNDPMMDLVIHKNENYEYAEERRLFYVALTRTKNTVSILSPIDNTSRFIRELSNTEVINLSGRKWENKSFICPECHCRLVRNYWNKKGIEPLYQCVNDKKVCGFETNDLNYKKRIILCPNCKRGYLIVVRKREKAFYRCTEYEKGCNYEEML